MTLNLLMFAGSRNASKKYPQKGEKNMCHMVYVTGHLSPVTCPLSPTPTATATNPPPPNSNTMNTGWFTIFLFFILHKQQGFLVLQSYWYTLQPEVSSSLGSGCRWRGQATTYPRTLWLIHGADSLKIRHTEDHSSSWVMRIVEESWLKNMKKLIESSLYPRRSTVRGQSFFSISSGGPLPSYPRKN